MRTRGTDPYPAHRFRVSCDELPELGFTEVRGLSVSVAVGDAEAPAVDRLDWRDLRSRPDRPTEEIPSSRRETRSPTLELRRGVTDDQSLWTWLQSWVAGEAEPQDVYVCLLDDEGRPVRGWVCRAATPARWVGPDLVADRAAVATETLELVHEGIEAVTDLARCGQ